MYFSSMYTSVDSGIILHILPTKDHTHTQIAQSSAVMCNVALVKLITTLGTVVAIDVGWLLVI